MNKNNAYINEQILMELGLEVGQNKRIIDSDTCRPIQMNGKYLVAPGCAESRMTQEFDPYLNSRMMEKLFSFYTQKEGNENISAVWHNYDTKDRSTGSIECTIRDDNGTTRNIKSDSYHADSLKYLDLLRKINNTSDSLDLKSMDYEKPKPVKQKKNAAAPTYTKKKRGM